MHHLVTGCINVSFFEAGGSFIGLLIHLLILTLCTTLVEQVIRAGLGITCTGVLLVVSVNVLLAATIENYRLSHVVWILVQLAALIIASWPLSTAATHHHVDL